MALTQEQQQRRLDSYIEAEKKALVGQEYRISDRQLKRANLSEIRAGIAELTAAAEVARQNGKGCVKRVCF